MDTQSLNLPLFLWALSWNDDNLIKNSKAHFARTALMVSDELPTILENWHKPPCAHGQGIRTKAAKKAMTDWALGMICEKVDDEMQTIKDLMSLPQEEISEESLLSICWGELISDV